MAPIPVIEPGDLGICWSGQPVTIRRLRGGDALLCRLSYSRMVGSGGN
jgi:hypothetical protein